MENNKVITMFANTIKDNIKWTFRNAYKKDQTPLWKALEKKITNSRSNYSEINISKLDNVTSNDEVIVVPGKVLGTGIINHKLTICSFSISVTAIKKIISAGGKVITVQELVDKYPNGNGVRIIG